MAIAMTIEQYLKDHGVEYEVLPHSKTLTSFQTIRESQISGDSLAKGIVLKGQDGYWVAVIPASHHLRIDEVNKLLRQPVGMATEAEIQPLFPDCDIGAIPALASAYGLSMVVDDSIEEQQDIFLEGGDHCNLVHIGRDQFHKLTESVPHGRFSAHD